MKRTSALGSWLLVAGLLGALPLGGCKGLELGWWNWFDPASQIRTTRAVNNIFPNAGPLDQSSDLIPNASAPASDDLTAIEEDYAVGPSDILRIGIMDLYAEGVEAVLEKQVSDTGFIDLPLLPARVKISGLTQDQVTAEIKRSYQPDILLNAVVSVTVVVARQNTFSILGAISRPGPYPIPRRDFRLYEALASAGDISQVGVPYLYIFRSTGEGKKVTRTSTLPELPSLPEIPDSAEPPTSRPAAGTTSKTATAPTGTSLEEQLRQLEQSIPGAKPGPRPTAMRLSQASGRAALAQTKPDNGDLNDATQTEKWIYVNGQFVRVPQSTASTAPAKATAGAERPADSDDPYGWMAQDLSRLTRIIAIDVKKFREGNSAMNIVIRNNDVILVPALDVGEFYVMGEVNRPGVYSLTGRKVTVKMALAAAGNLGALSWPDNSILIRRVGANQEQYIPLDLNGILAGREPDLFLKADDVVAIGTHWSAPFLAVWRNAFRMTYGFGFIYDRNYSDREFEIPFISPGSAWRN